MKRLPPGAAALIRQQKRLRAGIIPWSTIAKLYGLSRWAVLKEAGKR